MGTGSKVASVLLRLGEFCSAIIVVALLGRFFYLINLANASANGRLVYAEVVSALAIVASVILIVPAKYSFYAFPVDVVFFIMSIVAFSLLASQDDSCSSGWYYSYWGFHWGRFWTIPNVTINTIGSTGCRTWRSILAFSFIGAFCWLLSAILGAFVTMELRQGHETHTASTIKEKMLHKRQHSLASSGSAPMQDAQGTTQPAQTV